MSVEARRGSKLWLLSPLPRHGFSICSQTAPLVLLTALARRPLGTRRCSLDYRRTDARLSFNNLQDPLPATSLIVTVDLTLAGVQGLGPWYDRASKCSYLQRADPGYPRRSDAPWRVQDGARCGQNVARSAILSRRLCPQRAKVADAREDTVTSGAKGNEMMSPALDGAPTLGRPATASKGELPAAHWMLASLVTLRSSVPRRPRRASCLRRIDARFARRILACGAGILADARRDTNARAPFGALDGSLPAARVLSLPSVARGYSRFARRVPACGARTLAPFGRSTVLAVVATLLGSLGSTRTYT